MSDIYQALKQRKLQQFDKEKKFLEKLFINTLCCLDYNINSYTITDKEFTDNFYVYNLFKSTQDDKKINLLEFEKYLESAGFTTEWLYHTVPVFGTGIETYTVDGLVIKW